MKRFTRADARGGILFELLLAVALAGAGVWLWNAWKRGALRLPAAVQKLLPARPGGPAFDASRPSAALQLKARELLARHGVKEAAIVKSYNQERSEGGVRWLEDTLEFEPPAAFDIARFRRDAAALAGSQGLAPPREEPKGESLILELGDGKRVYERLVIRGRFTGGR